MVEAISNSEPSFPYFVLKFTWFVPCAKPFSRLQRIFQMFSLSVWVCVAVVLFLVTVVSWCLAKQSNDIRSYANMSSTLYNIWAVTVGASVTEAPRSLRLKLLFFVFVWYCASISTLFQTFFTSFLVDPGYDKQLKSLEEILDSGIGFGYTNGYNILFETFSDLRQKEVAARVEICSTDWECIHRIRETATFATFVPNWLAYNYKNVINDHSTVCPLNDDDYVFSFISTYVQKGSLFLESFNRFIIIYIESGMADKALRASVFVPLANRNAADVSDGYIVFNLSHIRVAFYILFLGHILSFLLFLCEVLYKFSFGQL
jgi:hypothetical protein